MQVKVPQQIIEYEDKIFGPFTAKQFVYLLAGGGVIFILFVILPDSVKLFGTVILGLPVAALVIALAWLKVNDRPFEIFLVSIIVSVLKPRQRVWRREIALSGKEFLEPIDLKPAKPFLKAKKAAWEIRSSLDELALIVDSRGFGKPEARAPEEATELPQEERITTAPLEPYKEYVEAEEATAEQEEELSTIDGMLQEATAAAQRSRMLKAGEPTVETLQEAPSVRYPTSYKKEVTPEEEARYRAILKAAAQKKEARAVSPALRTVRKEHRQALGF